MSNDEAMGPARTPEQPQNVDTDLPARTLDCYGRYSKRFADATQSFGPGRI